MSDIPAFPSHGSMGEVAHEGMTLRDYFAAVALQGMFAADSADNVISLERKAELAYRAADHMLSEREK